LTTTILPRSDFSEKVPPPNCEPRMSGAALPTSALGTDVAETGWRVTSRIDRPTMATSTTTERIRT